MRTQSASITFLGWLAIFAAAIGVLLALKFLASPPSANPPSAEGTGHGQDQNLGA